ncbi:unnamed protein product [Onchocerca flexuosa]|uniref:Uncharacterized protein n=1 Tax=Onchocerca flexuosa TaxID=387005 RepID=A0A183GY18_9BILA|nr:unnamed protein product [Onchocerca flexuosa]
METICHFCDIWIGRNKAKIIDFNYESRKATPFQFVDTMAKKQLKDKKILKNDDELRNDRNYDSEDSEESRNEVILSGSNQIKKEIQG